MLSLSWLPIVWLRTIAVALILYVLFPRLSLNLEKFALKFKLSQLHVYYAMIAFWELVTVGIIFYLLKINDLSLSAIGLTGDLSPTAIVYVIIGVIISAGLYPLIQAFSKIIGWDMFWRRRKDTDWFPRDVEYLSTKREVVSMFLIVVISIPILEEIIYRGYVFTALLQNFDNIILVFILTSLIFARIHCLAGPGFMLYIFIGTFIPSFLYWKFGR